MQYFAVFGNPIAQSKSPAIHTMFAKQAKIDIQYDAILAPFDGFTRSVSDFFALDARVGANVTMPFKEEAFAMCDVLTDQAQSAQAVNTLFNSPQGLVGHNTDGLGLIQDLLRQAVSLKDQRVLLIGAGGAAKGVIKALFAQQINSLHIVNRNIKRAKELVVQNQALFPNWKITAGGFDSVQHEQFDVVINATSLSLSGAVPPIGNHVYKDARCVYDMVYSKEPTIFLQHAHKQGSRNLSDGLGMLVGQAAESFTFWTGQHVDTNPVLDVLRKAM